MQNQEFAHVLLLCVFKIKVSQRQMGVSLLKMWTGVQLDVNVALVSPSHHSLHYFFLTVFPHISSAHVLPAFVRHGGSGGASPAWDGRPGTTVLQMFESAALSEVLLSHIQLHPLQGAFFFDFRDLHCFHFRPCLPAFRELPLIGRHQC